MGYILKVRGKDGVVRGIPAIRGDTGPAGPKGDTGSGLKVLDYYDTLAALQAAVPNPNAGDAYGVGTADPYDIYIYGETSGWKNNGPLQGAKGDPGAAGAPGKDGAAGQDGKDGVSPTVSVSEIEGGHQVTITDASGTNRFDVLDGVAGKDGSPGADGVGILSVEQTTTSTEDGGVNVITITLSSGSTVTFQVLNGREGSPGADGSPGAAGPAGYTPVRGTDYWTASDQQAIVDAVLAALPAAEGVSV